MVKKIIEFVRNRINEDYNRTGPYFVKVFSEIMVSSPRYWFVARPISLGHSLL